MSPLKFLEALGHLDDQYIQQAAQYKEQPLTFQLSHTPSRSKAEAAAPIALQLLCPQRAPFMRGRVFYF